MSIEIEKKVNISISIRKTLLKQLKEYKKQHGVSISWLINTLLCNYLNSRSELKYEE